jgi:hypothetical protein
MVVTDCGLFPNDASARLKSPGLIRFVAGFRVTRIGAVLQPQPVTVYPPATNRFSSTSGVSDPLAIVRFEVASLSCAWAETYQHKV